jgi:hypothetical protein
MQLKLSSNLREKVDCRNQGLALGSSATSDTSLFRVLITYSIKCRISILNNKAYVHLSISTPRPLNATLILISSYAERRRRNANGRPGS